MQESCGLKQGEMMRHTWNVIAQLGWLGQEKTLLRSILLDAEETNRKYFVFASLINSKEQPIIFILEYIQR